MTPDEQHAYALAEARIAEAKAQGSTFLNLSGGEGAVAWDEETQAGDARFRSLTRLPPELAECTQLEWLTLSHTQVAEIGALSGLTGLQELSLGNTQVAEIGALSGLTGLRVLYLYNTQVAEIGALSGLTGLQRLILRNTQVAEIGALSGLPELSTLWLENSQVVDLGPLTGLDGLEDLEISGIPACAAEPELDALSRNRNDPERTRKTLAWLRARRDAEAEPDPTATLTPEDLPEQEAALRVLPSGQGLDVAAGLPTPGEAEDPLRQKLYERLRSNVGALAAKAGNTHARLAERARRMLAALGQNLGAVDLVDLYLDTEELRLDLQQDNAARDLPYEPDVLVLLELTVRNAGGLLIGTEEIDRIEMRVEQMVGGGPVSERTEVAEALARKIIADDTLFGERLRSYLGLTVEGGSEGRLATVQQVLAKNSLIAAGLLFVVGSAASGFIGSVTTEIISARAAAEFLVATSSEILAFAAQWNQWAAGWLVPVVDEARVALRMWDRTKTTPEE